MKKLLVVEFNSPCGLGERIADCIWHCEQIATKSRLLIFRNSTGGSRGSFLYSSSLSMAATCREDGPWHISQSIPGSRKSRFSDAKAPPSTLRNWLVWHTAQTA